MGQSLSAEKYVCTTGILNKLDWSSLPLPSSASAWPGFTAMPSSVGELRIKLNWRPKTETNKQSSRGAWSMPGLKWRQIWQPLTRRLSGPFSVILPSFMEKEKKEQKKREFLASSE